MTPPASVAARAEVPKDLFDTIATLRALVVQSYHERESAGLGRGPAAPSCDDPASSWAADAAIRNRTLPINLATVKALEAALAGFSSHR